MPRWTQGLCFAGVPGGNRWGVVPRSLVTVCEAGVATRTAEPCGVDSDDPDQPDVPVVPVDEVNDGEEPFQAEQDGGMESMTARGNASCNASGGAAIVWLLGFVLLFRRRSFDRAPGMGAQS